MSVVPRGLHQDAPQVGVAGLGDGAPTISLSARMLRGNEAGVAHDLSGVLKSREATELCSKRNSSHFGDASQSLERVDGSAELLRCSRRCAIDCGVESLDALRLVI